MDVSRELFALQHAEKGSFDNCYEIIQSSDALPEQKKLFSEKLFPLLLQKLESNLLEDIKQGKLRVHKYSSNLLKNYPEIEKTLSLIKQYLSPASSEASMQHVVNRAKIRSEMIRLDSKIASSDAFFEKVVMSVLNKRNVIRNVFEDPSKEVCRSIQKKLLDEILRTDERHPSWLSSASPEEVEQFLEKQLKKSLLIAYGVPEDEQESWMKVFDLVASKCADLVRKRTQVCEKELLSLFSLFPCEASTSVHLNASLIARKEFIDNIDYFTNITPQLVDIITTQKKGAVVDHEIDQLAKILDADMGNFLQGDELSIKHDYQFLRKWGRYLISEMKQGFPDESEITREGSCWALSLRWVAEELAKDPEQDSHDFIKNKLQIGCITPQDRLHQILYLQDASFIKFKEWHQPHGVQVVFDHLCLAHQKDFSIQKDAQDSFAEGLAQFINSSEFQELGGGVAQIGPQGHALCICVQEDPKNIFRISDPNWGTFQLHDKQQLIECLSDLFGNTPYVKAACYKRVVRGEKLVPKNELPVFKEPPHKELKREAYNAGQQNNENALNQLIAGNTEYRDLIIKQYLHGISVSLAGDHLQNRPSFKEIFNTILSLDSDQSKRQAIGILFGGSLADAFLSTENDVAKAAQACFSSLLNHSKEKQTKILEYILAHYVQRSPEHAVFFINQIEQSDQRKYFFDFITTKGVSSIFSLPITTPVARRDALFASLATALLKGSLENGNKVLFTISDKALVKNIFAQLGEKLFQQEIGVEETLILLCALPNLDSETQDRWIGELKPAILDIITDDTIADFCSRHPDISSIDLRLCTKITGKSLLSLGFHCNVESLVVSNSNITDEDVESLLQMNLDPHFLLLDLSGCEKITEKAIRAIINTCPRISVIRVIGCPNVSQQALESFVSERQDLMIIDPEGQMIF